MTQRVEVDDIERRSNNVTKRKFVMGLVGTCIQKEKDENQCKLVMRYKQFHAPMTPQKLRLKRPGLITLRSKPIFQGFVWSHHQFALACVAVIRKGRGRELRARDRARGRREEGSFPFSLARSHAPKFPLPPPLLTPATQASVH